MEGDLKGISNFLQLRSYFVALAFASIGTKLIFSDECDNIAKKEV